MELGRRRRVLPGWCWSSPSSVVPSRCMEVVGGGTSGSCPGKLAGRNIDGGRGMEAIAARPTGESRYDIADCAKLMSVSSESGEVMDGALLSKEGMDRDGSLGLMRERERVLTFPSGLSGCIDMSVSEERLDDMCERRSMTDEDADSGRTSFLLVNRMLVRQTIVRYPSNELSSLEARARFTRKMPMSTKDVAGTFHQVSSISVLAKVSEVGTTFA